MPQDESEKQPADAAKPPPRRSGAPGNCFLQCPQLLLLLLKLKVWRLFLLAVPVVLLLSNLYLVPWLAKRMLPKAEAAEKKHVSSHQLTFYDASDLAASKAKVLVDRSAFPGEAAAAINITTAGGGDGNWIEDCSPETDCRERLIHQTDASVVAAIRYSKSPEKARAVLECLDNRISDDSNDVPEVPELACPFLYNVMALSMQTKPKLDFFKDLQIFELKNLRSNKTKAKVVVERYDNSTLQSLPQSICADWIKASTFTQMSAISGIATVGLAVLGVGFYLLISTVSCIRMLKADGFLQQLFRSGLSVSSYWLAIWITTLVESLVFAGVFTMSHALQCPGVFSAAAMAKLFLFMVTLSLHLAAILLLLEILLPPMLIVSMLALIISVSHTVAFFVNETLKKKAPFLLYILPSLFSSEFFSALLNADVKRLYSTVSLQDEDTNRPLIILLALFIADLLLLLLLTYLDFLLNAGNGLCLPPYYPVTPDFWLLTGTKGSDDNAGPVSSESDMQLSHIEPVMGLAPIVVVDEVSKTYRCCCCHSRAPTVLNKLSCTICRGQITALIGHNGAGKSTLIKILTGEELPDTGAARIGGCLVTNPLLRLALRGRIGICPQFDVLCDSLTVMECIRVTLTSRAVSDSSQLERARGMLQRLGLGDKEDVLSCDLSGGQKRKVSTILALLGDPDVVFLDEPTSGLDPVSRRQLWQLLQEEKSSRSIILCTQFMDEADILADRKIFLCGGRIVCAGSSMFLKRAFGCSFTLNVSLKSKTSAQALLDQLKQVRVKSHHETELQLEVPATNPTALTQAVQVLESSGNIEAFGLSQASLDDIFMRLSGMDSADVIEAFRSGTLALSRLPEVAELPAEKPAMQEGGNLGQGSPGKAKARVVSQFGALFCLNIKRQVRVRSRLVGRFLVPAVLLAMMAICSVLFESNKPKSLNDPYMAQMDILTSPQKIRSEDFGKSDHPVVCVTDGAANPVSVEDCKLLALHGSARNETSRLPIVVQKSPSQTMKEFVSQTSTREKLSDKLNAKQWISEEQPCVVYYASSWLRNASNKDRSISIGVFVDESQQAFRDPTSKVHVYRRALAKMLKLFSAADVEGTTALALVKPINSAFLDTGMQLIVFYFVFSQFPVSYLSDPIEDMSSRVRGYLISTGMSLLAYWVNTFVMHWVQYAVCFAICVALLMISEAYRCAYLVLAALVPIALLGIVSNLLSVYTVAVFTKTKSTIVSNVCILVAVALPIAVFVLNDSPLKLTLLAWALPPAAPVVLLFSCTRYYFYKREYYNTADASALPGLTESLWKSQTIFHSLLAMPVHILVLCSVICLVEKGAAIREAVCRRGVHAELLGEADNDMEEGARKEAERVLGTPQNPQNVLEVRQLSKTHSNGVRAVRGVTFGALAGEIFGLLGANGAGKSTSMSVIVGDEVATEGVCEVRMPDGAWASGREGAAIGAIGFCPQHNPLLKCITVAEHIRFFADIRGLDSAEAEQQTARLMRSLGLEQHCNKRAGQLSGGNKRRLCLAIALLGDPALVVIDEASTGVDPENKRFIWGAIRSMMHKQRSVMVTTHSMEEVEALCSRVGIMNNGRMISVGTVQQLRSLHGDAYTLELLLDSEAESAVRQKKLSISKAVAAQFKGAQTQEDLGLGLVLQFSVPKSAVRSLSEALKWLAANQSRLGVSHWAFYQMSLDQVFVKLVKMYDRSAQQLGGRAAAVAE